MAFITLTITCPDKAGIVAAVSTFLSQHKAFITEAAQYGDPVTKKFFMRWVFSIEAQSPTLKEIEKDFIPVAQEFSMTWVMKDQNVKPKIMLLVSKFGHCLNHLLHQYQMGILPCTLVAVMSNHNDFKPMVEWHNIPFYYNPVDKKNGSQSDTQFLKILKELSPDLVVLARYMQILSPQLCQELSGRCINIHHSFLPSFKGAKPYHQAYARGVKIIGATAHYVTTTLDEGPIIDQSVERVDHTHNPDHLIAMGRDIENVVLSRAVRYHLENRVLINGSKTVVFK